MNRKLQHTIQALAASAAVFSLMLIAGGPAPASAPVAVPTVIFVATAEAATAIEAIDARVDGQDAASEGAGASRRRRSQHGATALPYFSFAQGLRQVTGS